MASPSEIAEARRAPDRMARTRQMAEVMREREAFGGSCTFAQLGAAGFTGGEVFAYIDDARAILAGRPGAGEIRVPPARAEAMALVEKAEAIRARQRPPGQFAREEGPSGEGERGSKDGDNLRRVLGERFGRLGPAILDDIGAAGLALAPADELRRREHREAELAGALEDTLPLIDAFLTVFARRPAPGWAEHRSRVASLVGGRT